MEDTLTYGLCGNIGIEAYFVERREVMVDINDGLVDLIIIEGIPTFIVELIRWYLSDAEEGVTSVNYPH